MVEERVQDYHLYRLSGTEIGDFYFCIGREKIYCNDVLMNNIGCRRVAGGILGMYRGNFVLH